MPPKVTINSISIFIADRNLQRFQQLGSKIHIY